MFELRAVAGPHVSGDVAESVMDVSRTGSFAW